MKISRQTWPQVEVYLKEKQEILIPIGSMEQHGPSGFLGTDFLTAQAIALGIGEKIGVYVAPPICYGMALHHMAFPGTISVKPSTLILYLCDIIESLAQHGFKKLYFINGHGGNIAPIYCAFSEAKKNLKNTECYLWNWWEMPELDDYHNKHFGSENGHHATCGEISVTMFTHECPNKLVSGNIADLAKAQDKASFWPLNAQEFRAQFPDGRMGSNPALASSEHGKALFELSVNAISEKINSKN